MSKIVSISTPENVNLEIELAGAGSRFAAALIDVMIQLLIIGVLGGMTFGMLYFFQIQNIFQNKLDDFNIKDVESYAIAIFLVVLSFIHFGYFIYFELSSSGQSPGKKIFGLKVIKSTGEGIGFYDSFLRNILRLFDMLPLFYFVAIFATSVTAKCQRIGDLASNTIVARVKKHESAQSLTWILNELQERKTENPFPQSETLQISLQDKEIVDEYLGMELQMGDRKKAIGKKLFDYLILKYQLNKNDYKTPRDLFDHLAGSNATDDTHASNVQD